VDAAGYLKLLVGDRDPQAPLFSTEEYEAILWSHRLSPGELARLGLSAGADGRVRMSLSPIGPEPTTLYAAPRGGILDQGAELLLDGAVVDPQVTPYTLHGGEGRVEFQTAPAAGSRLELLAYLADLRQAAAAALLMVASDRARLAQKVRLDGLSGDLEKAAQEVRRQAAAISALPRPLSLGGEPIL